ncbi:hypothetical protein TEA_015537 [Camellia sinensis var. sinensis]|uniref:Pentatricopeptide repeat-containing protein n=1 Tax=Camellia sinensis var. sinensis TaxID=542762 RepID=A0A4S4D0T7_CAMSN|nr:hypothetical protein TEA_015537 [Camellia sinensis var. sinensis]
MRWKVDQILDNLGVEDPESAIKFFNLLRNEYEFRHSWVSQFVIAHVLARKRRLKELRSFVQQMLQEEGSGSAPSLSELLWNRFRAWESSGVVWDMLAFVYSRSEMVHDALFVLAKMKDLKIQASILTYNSLLYNLRHTSIMWDVYDEIKASRTPQSEHTNSILIDGLCRQSLLQEAVAFLRENEGKHFGPCVASFNTLMSRCCKMGYVDVAKSFFCMMFKYGLLPDAYSYNILIHGLCIAGSMEEALEFSDDMERHGVEPDVVTYNILAKGFRLLGMMNGAWKIIRKMLLNGLNPDSVTYTILICGHCQTGNIEEGFKLREEMLSQGFQLNDISYSVLLSSLCKMGRVGEALSLLHEMESIGLKPDLITYSILIHGLCKQGDVRKAIQLYNKMCLKRIFPNAHAHSAILLGLSEKGTLLEARNFFDALTKGDLMEDIILYNIMIYRKLAEARTWLDTIKAHGLVPSAVTYTTLLNALCEEGNICGMLEVLNEMESGVVQPTNVTYTVIIKGLCKQKRLQESLQLLEDMYDKGISPDEITYNTLIHCFCKAHDMRKAFQLHNEMLLHNLQPSPITYNVLINGLCIYGDLKDADRLFSSLQDQNIGLTKVAYTTLIKAHCAKGDVCKIHEKLMILMVLTIGKNSPLVDLEVHHASLDLLIQSTVHRLGLGFLKSTASSGISRTPCFLLILSQSLGKTPAGNELQKSMAYGFAETFYLSSNNLHCSQQSKTVLSLSVQLREDSLQRRTLSSTAAAEALEEAIASEPIKTDDCELAAIDSIGIFLGRLQIEEAIELIRLEDDLQKQVMNACSVVSLGLGHVFVPIDPNHCEEFDPTTVPTLSEREFIKSAAFGPTLTCEVSEQMVMTAVLLFDMWKTLNLQDIDRMERLVLQHVNLCAVYRLFKIMALRKPFYLTSS